MYKIFISHTALDQPIAEGVVKVLNAAFKDEVQLYLAYERVIGGDDWKAELVKNLHENDAVISLLSPEAILKPWIYVEWSFYWFGEKKFYVLKTGNLSKNDIFEPMLSRQITDLEDKNSVRGLLEAITRDSQSPIPIPYEYIDMLMEAVQKGTEAKIQKYRYSTDNLPASEVEKRYIARYFFSREELEPYERIIMTMRDEVLKLNEIREIVRSKGSNEDRKVQIVDNLAATVGSAEKLNNIAFEIVKDGDLESPFLIKLIDLIALRNQAEMRRLAVYIIQQKQTESSAFRLIATKMVNMAELRKIAEVMIEYRKTDGSNFINLIGRFQNNRELLKVAETLIHQQLHTPKLNEVIRNQMEKNGKI